MTLTKAMKEAIVSQIVAKKYKGRAEKIEADLVALVEPMIAKQSEGLPIKECREFIRFEAMGRIEGDGIYEIVQLSKPYPEKGGESYPTVRPTKDIKTKLQERERLKTEREETKRLVRSILNSCNTTKQLLATAPEIAAFVPEEAQVVKALVPVGEVQKFRKMLEGLQPTGAR
jgi:hypothetical protein